MDRKTESDRENSHEGFYTIGEVTAKTGVKPYILRYWEREFPFLQPMKNRVGHRLYTERDLSIVRKIRELIHERGYSISGAKKVLLDVLLNKEKNPRKRYINEIREDLLDMLERINRTNSP
jgi:DNA-binding transcriptional MerR regulator